MADDKAYQAIEEFKARGDYSVKSKEKLIEDLQTYKLVNQYLFVTDKAIEAIKFKDHIDITLAKKKKDGNKIKQNKRD